MTDGLETPRKLCRFAELRPTLMSGDSNNDGVVMATFYRQSGGSFQSFAGYGTYEITAETWGYAYERVQTTQGTSPEDAVVSARLGGAMRTFDLSREGDTVVLTAGDDRREYDDPFVRRDEADAEHLLHAVSFPAGASPASVSTGAPSSRPQARREIAVARAGCQEPLRREPARGPQHKVKSAASTYLQSESRAAELTVKAMSIAVRSGGVGAMGLGGVRGAARVHGDERNTRDPSAQPRVGAARLV